MPSNNVASESQAGDLQVYLQDKEQLVIVADAVTVPASTASSRTSGPTMPYMVALSYELVENPALSSGADFPIKDLAVRLEIIKNAAEVIHGVNSASSQQSTPEKWSEQIFQLVDGAIVDWSDTVKAEARSSGVLNSSVLPESDRPASVTFTRDGEGRVQTRPSCLSLAVVDGRIEVQTGDPREALQQMYANDEELQANILEESRTQADPAGYLANRLVSLRDTDCQLQGINVVVWRSDVPSKLDNLHTEMTSIAARRVQMTDTAADAQAEAQLTWPNKEALRLAIRSLEISTLGWSARETSQDQSDGLDDVPDLESDAERAESESE